ncbi:CHAD domain-containing protein [Zafaria cholistanensis]|uniref:CHAD domain-containing protein n=1 Tax=Zafaria cholistanensis TaxID=1682741 RepID=A0A5A7NQI6_9MICC|nr:CYTH and CHAD domain-containing protein [Zafaria cholistanensis]GER22247.1 CHAD domain-containing protein [Zafaria cholistanensis]
MVLEALAGVERKYTVSEGTRLPELRNLPAVQRVDPPEELDLEEFYFDTADLVLARRGITLRRATGGQGAGWRLAVPDGNGGRREVAEPAGGKPGPVPEALLRLVRVHVRAKPLGPVARISMHRSVHRLRGVEGVLAEVWDDEVQSEATTGGALMGLWREWDVELAAGGPELLDAAEGLFTAAGARRETHSSKLARALGEIPVHREPEPPSPSAKGPASAVLLAYLHRHLAQLREQDPLVRANAPDAIHQMRATTRKMRSALATYRKLLEPEAARRLRGELKWLAGVLGEARDAEAVRGRLADKVAHEPGDLLLGPVGHRIEEELGATYTAARARVLHALEEERYFELLDSLEGLLQHPPLNGRASRRAGKALPKLVERDAKRLRRDAAAALAGGEGDRDAALHEARKSAKRLRHAAGSAAPVLGKRARRLAKAAHRIQKILGAHHDSVVARHVLRELAAQAPGTAENGFSYGRLHALEQAAAAESEAAFRAAWKRFPAAPLKKA